MLKEVHPMDKESIERLRQAARAVDEHIHGELQKTREGLVVTLWRTERPPPGRAARMLARARDRC